MARRKKKWIQSSRARMKRKGTVGSFRRWCKRQGFSKVTAACIVKGLRSKNPKIRKKANWVRNVLKSKRRKKRRRRR